MDIHSAIVGPAIVDSLSVANAVVDLDHHLGLGVVVDNERKPTSVYCWIVGVWKPPIKSPSRSGRSTHIRFLQSSSIILPAHMAARSLIFSGRAMPKEACCLSQEAEGSDDYALTDAFPLSLAQNA